MSWSWDSLSFVVPLIFRFYIIILKEKSFHCFLKMLCLDSFRVTLWAVLHLISGHHAPRGSHGRRADAVPLATRRESYCQSHPQYCFPVQPLHQVDYCMHTHMQSIVSNKKLEEKEAVLCIKGCIKNNSSGITIRKVHVTLGNTRKTTKTQNAS